MKPVMTSSMTNRNFEGKEPPTKNCKTLKKKIKQYSFPEPMSKSRYTTARITVTSNAQNSKTRPIITKMYPKLQSSLGAQSIASKGECSLLENICKIASSPQK